MILLTGGLGYIGSHVIHALQGLPTDIVIFENLHNTTISVLAALESLGCTNLHFERGDLRQIDDLRAIFEKYPIKSVIHLAALKSVSESEQYPELYSAVNIKGTINLLHVMAKYQCTQLIYSSSATVYGTAPAPVTEESPTGIGLACNYARNKYAVEQYLLEHYSSWSICILRYFNPIGAHPSGLLRENPQQAANNIFPHLLNVTRTANHSQSFTIFGDDYDTPDGTCIRDYIHVVDLAYAHRLALEKISPGIKIYNVGTGKGTSVKELVKAFNDAYYEKTGQTITWKIGERRPGDLAISYAQCTKIQEELGFIAKRTINEMCRDGLKST